MSESKNDIASLLALVGNKARRVLAAHGIDTKQKLICLKKAQVLGLQSTGVKTWEEIQKIQEICRRFFSNPNETDHASASFDAISDVFKPIPKDSRSSFAGIVRYWLSESFSAERTLKIMEMRLGLLTGHPATLEACAASEGITRERVRQIQARAVEKLKNPYVVAMLSEFWASVIRCLDGTGGIVSLDELAPVLREEYQWPSTPKTAVLAGILDFCPAFLVSGNSVYSKDQVECVNCDSIRVAILRAVDRHAELPLDDASNVLLQCCNECNSPAASRLSWFSSDFIQHIIQSSESLCAKTRYRDGVLYSIDEWTLRFGYQYLAAAIVLKRKGKPMHFSEVAAELQRLRDDEITDRVVHECLNRCEDVMLWDRGTFIHVDHLNVPHDLLGDIEAWLVGQLRNGIPCMSVFGVFTQFANECKRAGVISESALYSSLRLFGGDVLAYPRYPYIYLRHRGAEHVPGYLIVEDWLRDAEGPVSNKRLKEFVCTEMGMKPFQLARIKNQVPNVVQNDAWEYLHTSTLTFGKDDVAPLVSHAQRLLSDSPSVSATKIFQDKAVTCHQMGISGPRMLFNVLRVFAADVLNSKGYPTVKAQDKHEAGKWRGVVADVEAFIKAQGRPCASDEISEEFVEKLGYRPATVFSVLYRGNVFRYLQGCIVHRDVIEWDDAKQSLLERVLREAYRQARDAGMAYGELDRVIEAREGELPTLGHDIPWTATLLADIAGKSHSFAVMGTAENAFVESPNDLCIGSLGDLVAWLLRTEYGGAMNHGELTDALRSRGIVRKNLTSSMLGDESAVVIVGHEIMLKELV